MALASARWSWLPLVVAGSIASGCGDDPGPPRTGVINRRPVPGCEAIDPSPCDVLDTACQTRLMDLAACLRGSSPQALPPVSRMTEAEYAELLTAEILAEDPPPDLAHYEAALAMVGLVAPGAFTPATMAAMQASRVAGFYRSDMDDIVLIDRGLPADDIDINKTLLHEFVHALQDRDQDLPTWFDEHVDTYDATLAAISVVEGEARLHDQRFGVSLLGLDPAVVDLAKHFDNSVRRATDWVRAQPSPYLASYSAFPYEYGARLLLPRFTQAGPQAIADLFAAPPGGTRVLLDPNGATPPGYVAPPGPAPPPEWSLALEATLGAWSLYLVLARDDVQGDADRIARACRGDRLWVYRGTGAAGTTTAMVWRLGFADSSTAMLAAQRLSSRFASQLFGADVVVAASDAGTLLDWAFALPPQSAPAPDDGGLEPASPVSASGWIDRAVRKLLNGS